jgi:Tfp pilus assembly protein PilO
VWLFSAPGKYYVSDTLSPLGCDSRIVNGIKIYLIAFWSYFMLLLVTMIINMCWNSYKELEDPEVAANEAKTLRNQWTLRSSRIQNY